MGSGKSAWFLSTGLNDTLFVGIKSPQIHGIPQIPFPDRMFMIDVESGNKGKQHTSKSTSYAINIFSVVLNPGLIHQGSREIHVFLFLNLFSA